MILSLEVVHGGGKCQNVRVRLAHCLMFGLPQKVLMMSNNNPLHYNDKRSRFKTYRLNELLKLPPVSFLIPPYILNNSFAVLYGAPASYKSFLALDWSLSLAHGIDWNGRATKRGSVVYLAMEGQAGLRQRITAWHKNTGLNPDDIDFICFITPLSLADAATENSDMKGMIGEINNKFGGEKPKLIVVDTLARSFIGRDENSSIDMGIFINNIDILRQYYGCTVLVVHHSGKDSSRGMRGSSALRGAIDSEFEIKRKLDTMSVCLKTKKQKDSEEAEPLWMEAREVSWVDSALSLERKSLVLDKCDEKPKDFSISPDQKKALVILDEMLKGFQDETDRFGNVGVSEKAWREELGKELSSASVTNNWGRFKKQFEDRGLLVFENGLVRKSGV